MKSMIVSVQTGELSTRSSRGGRTVICIWSSTLRNAGGRTGNIMMARMLGWVGDNGIKRWKLLRTTTTSVK